MKKGHNMQEINFKSKQNSLVLRNLKLWNLKVKEKKGVFTVEISSDYTDTLTILIQRAGGFLC